MAVKNKPILFPLPEEEYIGPWLQAIREHYGLSRAEVAKRIGFPEYVVRNIECRDWSAMPIQKDKSGRKNRNKRPYNAGARITLFKARTMFRLWGFELWLVPVSYHCPKFADNKHVRPWKLSDQQGIIAEYHLRGMSSTTIASIIQTPLPNVSRTLSLDRVRMYVEARKREIYELTNAMVIEKALDIVKSNYPTRLA